MPIGLTGTVATRADIEASEARLRHEITELRGRLMTQAFAIIGALATIVGLAAVLTHLFH